MSESWIKTLWSALTSLQFSFCPKYFRFKLSTLWVHYSSGSSWRFWGKISHVLWLLSREVVDSTSFPFSFPSSSHVSYLDHTLIFTPQGIQDFFKVAASNSIFLIKNVCWNGWHPKKTLWYTHKKSYLLLTAIQNFLQCSTRANYSGTFRKV